jgi:energy-coupling factor transporter ATP-binding protein EcfA2
VDLGTDDWTAIKVTPGNWESTRNPNVQFRRAQSMKALPQPIGPGEEKTNPLSLLRKHVRVKSDEDFALLLAWIVQALRPEGPYPILVLTGEQGSGKTTTAKMIRSLVDPSHIPTRSAPRQEEDLVVAAENAWVLVFDNMSGVSPWLSDALCRLSTGGGFGTRQHYTNREEATFYHKRPLILNGIGDLTARPDLADRALIIQLEAIPESDRKSDREIWNSFEEDRPTIFYGLLNALATALDFVDEVELKSRPRMMDFAEWAVAAEPAFPLGPGTFEDAYASNRQKANETALENDPVALAITMMLEEEGEWSGKTSDLQEDLKKWVHNPENPPPELASYQALGQHLRRIMPVLREAGVEREDDPRERSRRFKLVLDEQEVPF